MPNSDLPLTELERFDAQADGGVVEPPDFDEFWARTLAESRARGGDAVVAPVESPFREIRFEDLTFPGFGGEPVRAWVARPASGGDGSAVVEFLGYGGGRGVPGERLQWPASGSIHVLMDTRGQGGSWGTGGETPDPHGSGPATPGFMTRGIEHQERYYYRRLFTDAVRLVDAVRTLPGVDPARIAVTGGSQGGGIALAVAGLVPDLLGVMPDVPFLCCFRRAVELTVRDPFAEIARYLAVNRARVEEVFRTLSYFDGVVFARRAQAPALFSVGLADEVVLPSTVYAAYNAYAGRAREMAVYPFNSHEGGGLHHWTRQVRWLRALERG